MLIKDVLQKTTQFFRDKGFPSPRLDSELLMAEALSIDRVRLYMNYDNPLSEEEVASCRELVKRRAKGEPVAYILGKKDFFKSTFIVRPGILIPRPETEFLVESVLEYSSEKPLRIVDFGAGSGCVGLSILRELPDACLISVDQSAVACRVTEENALRLDLSDRVRVLQTLVEELDAKILKKEWGELADVIVANPPYISPDDPEVEINVRQFEPGEALFSDEKGLAHIKKWSTQAAKLLKPGGLVVFEIGASQRQAALEIFGAIGAFQNIQGLKDLAGRDRYIQAIKGDCHG